MLPLMWRSEERIEAGESQEAAVVREVGEETGLHVRALEKVWECPSDDGLFRLHWWTVDTDSAELELDPGEVSEARWVTPAEFLELKPTFEADREFVSHVLPSVSR